MTYRLTKGLQALYSTPPPVGSVCREWRTEEGYVWLDARAEGNPAEYRFRVPVGMLESHFLPVGGTEKRGKR
jgi:hypothetical protein